jgi:hypothetical protein
VREILLVARREFDERVRTRSFVIGTALLPLLVLAVVALPGMAGDTATRRVVVIDQAPAPLGDAFLFASPAAASGLDSLVIPPAGEPPTRSNACSARSGNRAELAGKLMAKQIDAWCSCRRTCAVGTHPPDAPLAATSPSWISRRRRRGTGHALARSASARRHGAARSVNIGTTAGTAATPPASPAGVLLGIHRGHPY